MGHSDVQLCHRWIVSKQFCFHTTKCTIQNLQIYICGANVSPRYLWLSLFKNLFWSVCSQSCASVQLFKRTDGKPGGSPLLLPHVQISHRFWRPVLPVYTGHPVRIFPRLGLVSETRAWDFVIWAFYGEVFCLTRLLSSLLQVSVLPEQEGRCGWFWSPAHQETSCTADGGRGRWRTAQLGPRLSSGDWMRGEGSDSHS